MLFKIVYYALQWTWAIVQNVAGLCIFLANVRRRHFWYNGALATLWRSRSGSLGIGMFIFIGENAAANEKSLPYTLQHEFGHTIQSIILGPLFLPVIGAPSLLWAGLPAAKRFREKNSVSYDRFYTERWANFLGERAFTGE